MAAYTVGYLYSYDYDAKYECTPCCHAMLERSRSV